MFTVYASHISSVHVSFHFMIIHRSHYYTCVRISLLALYSKLVPPRNHPLPSDELRSIPSTVLYTVVAIGLSIPLLRSYFPSFHIAVPYLPSPFPLSFLLRTIHNLQYVY